MPKIKYDKQNIANDLLELLNDTQIKETLTENNISVEMVEYIINDYLYKNFLDSIVVTDITLKDREKIKFENLNNNIFLNHALLQSNDILNSFCRVIMHDIIATISFLKETDEKSGLLGQRKETPKYLKNLKKIQENIEKFLKEHFDLPKPYTQLETFLTKLSNLPKNYELTEFFNLEKMEQSDLHEEIDDFWITLKYLKDIVKPADSIFKPFLYDEVREFFKNYEKITNQTLTGCDEFNIITGLNINSDFHIFKNMIESYVCFSQKIDTIENGLGNYNDFVTKRFFKYNTYFDLGIKNAIDDKVFIGRIKQGYKKFTNYS